MAIFHPALRLAVLIMSSLALGSCGGGGGVDNQLSLRMINVAPDSPPVNFLVDGVVFGAGADYKSGTGYNIVTPRNYEILMEAILPGGNVLIGDRNPKNLEAGQEYSYIAIGNTTNVKLLQIKHPREDIPADRARLEVLHAAPGVGPLDVYLTAAGESLTAGGRIATGVVYERLPDIRPTQPLGTYVIRVTPAGITDNVLFESSELPLRSRDDLLLIIAANTLAGPSPISVLINNRFSTGELTNKDTPSDLRVVHLSPDAPALDVVAHAATTTSPELTFTNSVAPVAVVLDSANGRALTVDNRLRAVVAVDLATGARTVLSDSSTPDAVNALLSPVGIALDSANNRNRALVVDNRLRAVVAVDLTTGVRTILAEPASTTPLALRAPTGIAIDYDADGNGRALVTDAGLRAVVAVDLVSGTRMILSSNTIPDAVNPLTGPIGIAVDGGRALLLDLGPVAAAGDVRPAIVAVNLATGARTIVSNDDLPADRAAPVPPATVGLPINPFGNPVGIVLDGSQALVTDAGLRAVLAVDLATGARTVRSNRSLPNADNPWGNPLGIAIDAANSRALVADNRLGAVVAVSLADGARTILSPNQPPNSLGYLQRSAYLSVPIDVYTLRGEKSAEPSPTTPLFTSTLTLGAGQRRTLLALGLLLPMTPTLDDLVLTDDIRPLFAAGKLRIVHASPAAGTVDVYVLKPGDDFANAAVVPTLPGRVFRTATGHGTFAIPAGAGSYTVTFTLAGDKTKVVATAAVPVTGGSVQTVILADAVRADASSDGKPASVLVLNDLTP